MDELSYDEAERLGELAGTYLNRLSNEELYEMIQLAGQAAVTAADELANRGRQ